MQGKKGGETSWEQHELIHPLFEPRDTVLLNEQGLKSALY